MIIMVVSSGSCICNKDLIRAIIDRYRIVEIPDIGTLRCDAPTIKNILTYNKKDLSYSSHSFDGEQFKADREREKVKLKVNTNYKKIYR